MLTQSKNPTELLAMPVEVSDWADVPLTSALGTQLPAY